MSKENEKTKQEKIEQVKKILKENEIEMSVDGCGCCGSPWVKFVSKGEEIIDEDEVKF